jgi:hypothetical protein
LNAVFLFIEGIRAIAALLSPWQTTKKELGRSDKALSVELIIGICLHARTMPEQCDLDQNNGHGDQEPSSIDAPIPKPAGIHDQHAESRHQRIREGLRLLIEFAALVGLFCYAHSASIQATATKDSVDALWASFRPWVGIYGPVKLHGALTDATFGFRFALQNSGHSPAFNVAVRTDVHLGPPETQTTVRKLPNGGVALNYMRRRQPVTLLTLDDCKAAPAKSYANMTYFPENSYEIDGPSIRRPPPTTEEKDDVLHGVRGLFFFGCIDYDDGASPPRHHQTKICMRLSPANNEFEFCPGGNAAN